VKRAKRCARLTNDRPAPLSLHWHGVRLPNAMDGCRRTSRSIGEADYRRAARRRHLLVPRAVRLRTVRRADRREAAPVDVRDVVFLLDGVMHRDIPFGANDTRARAPDQCRRPSRTVSIDRHPVRHGDRQPAGRAVRRARGVTLRPATASTCSSMRR
jgi:hypothetical protein